MTILKNISFSLKCHIFEFFWFVFEKIITFHPADWACHSFVSALPPCYRRPVFATFFKRNLLAFPQIRCKIDFCLRTARLLTSIGFWFVFENFITFHPTDWACYSFVSAVPPS